jgi:hypothetical protein
MANEPPRVGPVIINEIHYHPVTGTWPSTDEPHHEEYLELFNLSDTHQPPERPDAGYVPYLLIDQIVYKNQAPWPTAADGTGASLQRLAPSAYGNDPAHWHAASPTPGSANDSVAGPSIVVQFNSLTADLTLAWSATPGSRYLVQHHQEIQTSGWQDAAMLTATGHVLSFTEINPAAGPYRFYRVLWVD